MSAGRIVAGWTATIAGLAVLTVAALGVRAAAPTPVDRDGQLSQAERVTRGAYLVNAMGCNDCHTPLKMGANGPEPDMTRFLSGHQADEKLPPAPAPSGPWIVSVSASGTAWSGPWGISYTQNITPDMDTGIGNYSEEQFVMTMREGKKQGRGRDILPPMPWQAFKNLTDEDLKSMYAYLRTVTPVRNRVPDPVIAGAPK